MHEILNALVKTKITTMIVLGIMFIVGGYLITGPEGITSIEGTVGIIILCSSAVLGVVAFLDYRNKETTDAAISQMETVVKSLTKALEASIDTSITSEKGRQQVLQSQQRNRTA